jgi:carbonic anhydrase
MIPQLWRHTPVSEGKEIAGVDIHPAGWLPRDAASFMYMGSLTAPPRTEGMQRFVLKTTMEISLELVNAGPTLSGRCATLQPLNGRVVKEGQ